MVKIEVVVEKQEVPSTLAAAVLAVVAVVVVVVVVVVVKTNKEKTNNFRVKFLGKAVKLTDLETRMS